MEKTKRTKKDKKPEKLFPWKNFSPEKYQQAAESMVHFSAKAVNSNTLGFGIRLAKEVHRDLPYVAVSTIQNRQDIPLDFYDGGATQATQPKQINAVRHNRLERFEPVPEADRAAILACADILGTAHEPKDAVGIRLRQIILQDADGNDIAATPLPSPGFSALLEERLREERDQYKSSEKNADPSNELSKNQKKLIPRTHARLGIGGANPQNAGLNIRAMQQPLMFKVPTIQLAIRQALAIYHQGITKKPNYLDWHTSPLADFIVWRANYSADYFVDNPTNLEIRQKEKNFLTQLTHHFLQQIDETQILLQECREKLPEQKVCSPNLLMLDQALLDSTLRDMAWRRECAQWLHHQFLIQSVWIEKERKKKNINCSKHETLHWISIIEGALA